MPVYSYQPPARPESAARSESAAPKSEPAVTTLPSAVPLEERRRDMDTGLVQVPVTAAAIPGLNSSGSVTGTLELTTAQAERMGVYPGLTPGALFVPASGSPSSSAKSPSDEPKVQPAE